MLFVSLERSYISLCVFLCQVKFMKKEISKETLADLCYCDTSSIYLVTSGRKDPYCAKKKYQWQLFVWTSKSIGKQAGIVQVLHFGPCPVMSVKFDRFLHLQGVSLAVLGEAHLRSVGHRVETTDLGFAQICMCLRLCSASNHGDYWLQNLVIAVRICCAAMHGVEERQPSFF